MKFLLKLRWAFIVWAARRLPPCCDIAHQISDAHQHRPSLRERIVIRSHLFVCDWCTDYSRQIILMSEAGRRESRAVDSGTAQPLRLSDSARQRFQRALEQAE